MKYAANTLLWTASFDGSHLGLLDQISSWGFDGVEIARFSFDDFPAAEVRRAVQDSGLECTFCSALTADLNLVSDDAVTRRRAAEFLRRGIACTAEIGAEIFVGPFCAPVGYLPGRRRNQDEWKWAVDELQALGPVLNAHGVTLAIEPLNRFETYFLNTAEDGLRLVSDVNHPKIGILCDTFHANIEEKSVAGAYRLLGSQLKHVHACENDRGTPGSGHVEWREVMEALLEIQYEGWIAIESFASAVKEIAAATCIWRDLAPSSEALARDGIRFLKSLEGAAGVAV